jgi:myo-inositol-1-phosphate synthase
MAKARIGIWLIGANGGVATTTIVGLAALKKGLVGTGGLVTALPPFCQLPLVEWADLVVGGHEIRRLRLADEAARLAADNRALSPELVAQLRGELAAIDSRVLPGTIINVGQTIAAMADDHVPRGETPRQAVDRLRRDLLQFAQQNELEHVVVVNLASTEPPTDAASLPETWEQLEGRLDESLLPASSLCAIAALEEGCSYVNFTPSLGSSPAAIGQLVRLRNTRHMGCDGKTGETLLKSTLAPTFARRNLQVMSWVGHNIFGNMDGRVLDDPANKRAKVASKDHLLSKILGYSPQTHVSIEYIQSLGDWKTAWDHVHFRGFLDLPMALQFTWQGCDSVLAAPLVLDLVRLTELARRRGQTGTLEFLASFFKSPLGVEEHCFDRQFRMLQQWAEEMTTDQ